MSDWQLSQNTVDFRNEERRAGNRGEQTQPTLFPDPPKCGARGCQAGTRRNLCRHDADLEHGLRDPYAPRPRTCLLRYDPADGKVPY